MYVGNSNFHRYRTNRSRARFNSRTPNEREFVIVAGTDHHGWVTYKIMATSEEEAQCKIELVETKRRREIDANE